VGCQWYRDYTVWGREYYLITELTNLHPLHRLLIANKIIVQLQHNNTKTDGPTPSRKWPSAYNKYVLTTLWFSLAFPLLGLSCGQDDVHKSVHWQPVDRWLQHLPHCGFRSELTVDCHLKLPNPSPPPVACEKGVLRVIHRCLTVDAHRDVNLAESMEVIAEAPVPGQELGQVKVDASYCTRVGRPEWAVWSSYRIPQRTISFASCWESPSRELCEGPRLPACARTQSPAP